MATNDKREPRKPAKASSAATNDFNGAADIDPRANRTQLLKEAKTILNQRIDGHNFRTVDGEELTPTRNQNAFMGVLSNKPIVFVDGPLGTGKTLWATYMALVGLTNKKYNYITLTAPAVEAGEKLGSLPGTKDEKMLPHIIQILGNIDEWIGKDLRVKLQDAGVIEIESHAFMRGRTFKKTFVILDESQNASGKNLMTAAGRIGRDSTFVFMGDDAQNDRTKGNSAFVAFFNRFTHQAYLDSGFVGYTVMDKTDVRRHPFLQLMVERDDHLPLVGFEDHHSNNTNVTRRALPANSNGHNGAWSASAPAPGKQ